MTTATPSPHFQSASRKGGYENVHNDGLIELPLTPRGELACVREGISPEDLIPRTVEDFMQGKKLPEHVCVLRCQFYEEKRKELLSVISRTRANIIAEMQKQAYLSGGESTVALSPMSVDGGNTSGGNVSPAGVNSSGKGIMVGNMQFSNSTEVLNSLMHSQPYELEKYKFERSMEVEQKWLLKALRNEHSRVKQLEKGVEYNEEQENLKLVKMREEAEKHRRLAERRRKETDQKVLEEEISRKIDRDKARKQFIERSEELKRLKDAEIKAQKERYEAQLQIEIRREEARIKLEKRKEAEEEEREIKKAQLDEMNRLMKLQRIQYMKNVQMNIHTMNEERFMHVRENISTQEANRKKEVKLIMQKSEEKQKEIQRKVYDKREAIMKGSTEKQMHDNLRRAMAKETAERNLKRVQSEILMRQEKANERQRELERQKKEQSALKQEYKSLFQISKEYNVERMMRKQQAYQEMVAEKLALKMARAQLIVEERSQLKLQRKAAIDNSLKARDLCKTLVHKMALKGKFNAHEIEKLIENIEKNKDMANNIFYDKSEGSAERKNYTDQHILKSNPKLLKLFDESNKPTHMQSTPALHANSPDRNLRSSPKLHDKYFYLEKNINMPSDKRMAEKYEGFSPASSRANSPSHQNHQNSTLNSTKPINNNNINNNSNNNTNISHSDKEQEHQKTAELVMN